MTNKEIIEVVSAAEAGKTIQRQPLSFDGLEWQDCSPMGSAWDFSNFDYRVKPGPREFWLNKSTGHFLTHCDAENRNAAHIIHVREVPE